MTNDLMIFSAKKDFHILIGFLKAGKLYCKSNKLQLKRSLFEKINISYATKTKCVLPAKLYFISTRADLQGLQSLTFWCILFNLVNFLQHKRAWYLPSYISLCSFRLTFHQAAYALWKYFSVLFPVLLSCGWGEHCYSLES